MLVEITCPNLSTFGNYTVIGTVQEEQNFDVTGEGTSRES